MLLRYALATLGGRGPRSLATPPILSSTSRLVVPASQPSSPHAHSEKLKFAQAQTRSSSGSSDDATQIDNLQPPWTVNDFSRTEMLAYQEYGPKFLEHLSPVHRARAKEAVKKRARTAAAYEALAGPDWYPLVPQALEMVKRQHEADVTAWREKRLQAANSLHDEQGRKRAEISSTLAQRLESLKELEQQLEKEYRAADGDEGDRIQSRIKQVAEQKHKLLSESKEEITRLHTWFTLEALPECKKRFQEEGQLIYKQYTGENLRRKQKEALQLLKARG